MNTEHMNIAYISYKADHFDGKNAIEMIWQIPLFFYISSQQAPQIRI